MSTGDDLTWLSTPIAVEIPVTKGGIPLTGDASQPRFRAKFIPLMAHVDISGEQLRRAALLARALGVSKVDDAKAARVLRLLKPHVPGLQVTLPALATEAPTSPPSVGRRQLWTRELEHKFLFHIEREFTFLRGPDERAIEAWQARPDRRLHADSKALGNKASRLRRELAERWQKEGGAFQDALAHHVGEAWDALTKRQRQAYVRLTQLNQEAAARVAGA